MIVSQLTLLFYVKNLYFIRFAFWVTLNHKLLKLYDVELFVPLQSVVTRLLYLCCKALLFIISAFCVVFNKLFTNCHWLIVLLMQVVLIINRRRNCVFIEKQQRFLFVLLLTDTRWRLHPMIIILWHAYEQWLFEFFHLYSSNFFLLSKFGSCQSLYFIISKLANVIFQCYDQI